MDFSDLKNVLLILLMKNSVAFSRDKNKLKSNGAVKLMRYLLVISFSFFLFACGASQAVFVPVHMEPPVVENVPKQPLVEDCNTFGSLGEYKIKPLTTEDKLRLIDKISTLKGVKYVWGGQDETGIDCSGLIVWAYEKLGFIGFKKNSDAVYDVTSNEMYLFNVNDSKILKNPDELIDYEAGDFIFYDKNGDGKVDHVAIFMSYNEDTGDVWIWDSSSNMKGVAYRPVADILKKRPRVGRPVMLVE